MAALQSEGLGFLEQWALSEDRREVLKTLVPGTDRWYYFQELLSEQEDYPADLEGAIEAFLAARAIDRDTPSQAERFKVRRKLIKFASEGEVAPADKALIKDLVDRFSISTSHRRELPAHADDSVDTTPTVLSGTAWSPATLLLRLGTDSSARSALDRAKRPPLEDTTIWSTLTGEPRHAPLLRWLLASHGVPRHLSSADKVAAVELVLAECKSDDHVGDDGRNSRFSTSTHFSASPSAPIFRDLTLGELRTLRSRGKVPKLHHNVEYVKALLGRLGPGEGVDMTVDLGAQTQYLNAVLHELSTLPLPAFMLPLLHAVYYHRVKLAEKLTGRLTGGLPGSGADVPHPGLSTVLSEAGGSGGLLGRLTGSGGLTLPTDRAEVFGSSDFYHLLTIPRARGHWAYTWRSTVEAKAGKHYHALLVTPGSGPLASLLQGLSPPHNSADEQVVKAGIQEILGGLPVSAALPGGLTDLVEKDTLGQWRAEALLLAGKGAEDTSLVRAVGGESTLVSLRDRVDLAFAPHNPTTFDVEDPVSLAVWVKNIPSLTISVFEINTTAYYQAKGSEISTSIDLDGLIPNDTTVVQVGGAPIHRALHTFPIEALSNPATARRGVFVVELVGGGFSTRALIRKGALRFVSRETPAGHAFRVLDETNTPVPSTGLSLWMGGRSFTPRDDGEVVIPFAQSDRAGSKVVITLAQEGGADGAPDWSFSSLGTFNHFAEHYFLEAAWFLEEETLVKDNRKATLVVRARLYQNAPGQTAPLSLPLSLLEKVRVTVESSDGDNVSSSKDFTGIALTADGETTLTFAVPPGLRRLTATLHGTVTAALTGAKVPLSSTHTTGVNAIDQTSRMKSVYLRYVGGEQGATGAATGAGAGEAGDWQLVVLGKSGEPLPGIHLYVTGEHPIFGSQATTLNTDSTGTAHLGPLHAAGFTSIAVRDQSSVGERFSNRTFPLVPPGTAMAHFHSDLVMVEGSGQPLVIPHDVPAGVTGTPFSLIATVKSNTPFTRGSSSPWSYFHPSLASRALLEDAGQYASWDPQGRAITLAALPAGVYQLTLFHATAAPTNIIVTVLDAATAGAVTASALATGAGAIPSALTAVDAVTVLQSGIAFNKPAPCPVRVAGVVPDGDHVIITTAGGVSTKKGGVRVHLAATHFAPFHPFMNALGTVGVKDVAISGAASQGASASQYIAPRKLGEEHRYILDRASASVSAGNTLPRPTLLLNAWAVGKTQTDTQEAAGGSAYASKTAASYGGGGRRSDITHDSWSSPANGATSHDVTLDFLATPARLLFNLAPGPDGILRVPLADLATEASGPVYLTVVAMDAVSSAAMALPLLPAPGVSLQAAEKASAWSRPMSLEYPLDPTKHFTQQKNVSVLRPGATASITAASDTKVEEYATLPRVSQLFAGLSGNLPGGSASASAALLRDFSWLSTWPTLSDSDKRAKYSKYACHEVHLFLYLKDRVFFDAIVAPFLACKRAKTFMDRFLLGEDLSYYTAPTPYAALNDAERALLIGRMPSAAGGLADGPDGSDPSARTAAVSAAGGAAHAFLLGQAAADAAGHNPTSSEMWELVFNSAISSNALEDDDAAHALMDQVAQEAKKSAEKSMAAAEQFLAASVDLDDCFGGPMAEAAMDIPMPSMAMAFASAPMAPMAPMAAMAPMPRNVPAGRKMAKRSAPRMRSLQQSAAELCEEEEDEGECSSLASSDEDSDLADRREVSQQAYRSLDKTEEFAEMHWWRVKSDVNTRHLVTFSEFWADFATHRAKYGEPAGADGTPNAGYVPFVSKNFALAARSLNEMLLALAVIDLPFANTDASDVSVGEGKLKYTAKASAVVLFHKDLQEAPEPASTTVLVGQNYFDPADRYKRVKGQQVDKYILGGEFLRHKVYGVQVVITNVSSASQELDYLLQIPQGAVPLQNGFTMKSFHNRLSAYSTTRREYFFYFPDLGSFVHYPVHVSADEELVAAARATVARVVDKPTFVDRESWQYVSQQGTLDEVVTFLTTRSLAGLDVGKVAWRCDTEGTWRTLTGILAARGVFHSTLWAYAFKHGDVSGIRQWLLQQRDAGSLQRQVAPVLPSSLVTWAPEPWVGALPGSGETFLRPAVSSGSYEHLEYSPLVNARAHQLGAERKIMNVQQRGQWRRLLEVLSHTPAGSVTTSARLAIVYHLLLQDRVGDAMAQFAKVPLPPGSAVPASGQPVPAPGTAAAEGSWCVLMYDYLAAYLDFFNVEEQPVAQAVAAAYAEHPVPKWQRKFAAIASQLAEAGAGVRGTAGAAAGGDDALHADAAEDKELARETQTGALMAGAPSLDVEAEGAALKVTYSNLTAVSLRFYLMDIELLFSTSAFVTADASGSASSAGQFAYVRPNAVHSVEVPACPHPGVEADALIPIPEAYRTKNVLVEVVAGGLTRTTPFFANTMRVAVVEDAGRVAVKDAASGRPLPKVYVKVYSRRSAGDSKGKFYKDGYTDLRGVFDYASLSTDELSHVQRFALLVKSPTAGAVIRTARPPSGSGSA